MLDHVNNGLQKLLSLYEYEKYEKESNYQWRQIEGGGYVIEEQISFPPQIICLLTNMVSVQLFHLSSKWTYRPLSSGGIGMLHAEQD